MTVDAVSTTATATFANRRLRRAIVIWLVAAMGEALVFVLETFKVSTHRGIGAWPMLLAEIAFSLGFPVSLWLSARALDALEPRRLAQLATAAAVISALVCLLYEFPRRLLPANIDLVIGPGIRVSSCSSLGWWGRNVEVFLTVLLFSRIAQRAHVRHAAKWPLLIGSVLAAKIASLLLHVGSSSTALSCLQRLVTIASGVLALRRAERGRW